MSEKGEALAAAAARLIGTPFRLHGRDPVTGLDCVGLIEAAMQGAGYALDTPLSYRLRNASIAPLLNALGEAPARRTDEPNIPDLAGDIVLCVLGSGQHHLLIIEHSGARPSSQVSFIHAHAGLRRVVRTPGTPPWPAFARWRFD